MISNSSSRVLDDIVVMATTKLFDSLGCDVRYAGQQVPDAVPPIDDAVVSILGFAGECMRGALTLVCHPRLVGRSLPGIQNTSSRPEAMIRDWSGELVNQLLGRIKNQVLRHGLDFRVAIPITVHAEALRVPPLDTGSGPWHQFESEAGAVWVRWDLRSEQAFLLPSLVPWEDEQLEEGELLLF